MAVRHKSVEVILASALAPSGTLNVSYPAGTSRTTFVRGVKHKMVALGGVYESPTDFTVALQASQAQITYNGATTIPAGSHVVVQLDAGGPAFDAVAETPPPRVKSLGRGLVLVEIGNPVVADPDGIFLSGAITAAAPLEVGDFTGALVAADGTVTLDVPRNIVAAWTGTAVMTVTGTDEYGSVLVESSASGTSLTGKKAFKTVTKVEVSANVTAATVGTGDVLGLPVFVPGAGNLLREVEDLAVASAGTLVAGLSPGTKSTATTADVRGTYDPASACDGTKAFALVMWLEDAAHKGNPQYAG